MRRGFTKPGLAEAIAGAERNPPGVFLGEAREATAAPVAPEAPPVPAVMPWDCGNPRVVTNFQFRIPEPLHMKLRWIVANSTGQASIHAFVLKAVEAAAEERLGKR
jgi:hypothetical protein